MAWQVPAPLQVSAALQVVLVVSPQAVPCATKASAGHAPAPSRIIDCAGACLAPGIIDIGVKVCEPGERHKESYRSAGLAAAAGGVTTMVTRPDTDPPIDSPETLEFVARRAAAAASGVSMVQTSSTATA